MKSGILIISHKRPDCPTAAALKKNGYNGEWFIVADDEDDTEYESAYPGHVIRFHKKQYVETIDTADNFGREHASVFARNACYDIAKQKDYDIFGLFDDDIYGFFYRYMDGKKLAVKKVQNLTKVFELYCQYVLDSGFACGAFVSNGRLIGGASNDLVKNKFYFNPCSVFLINMQVEHSRFTSTIWEDTVYCLLNNIRGKTVAAFMPITFTYAPQYDFDKAEMKGELGGCAELYENLGAYIPQSYLKMIVPSMVKIRLGAKRGGCRISSNNIPAILSGRYRKE